MSEGEEKNSSGKRFAVVYGHASSPLRCDWDHWGVVELEEDKLTLKQEGKRSDLKTEEKYTALIMLALVSAECAVLWLILGRLIFRDNARMAVGLAWMGQGMWLCVQGISLLTRLARKRGVGTKLMRRQAGPPVDFEAGEGWVVYHKEESAAAIKGAGEEWVTVMLNRAKCSGPMKEVREEFERELARCFGEQFQVL